MHRDSSNSTDAPQWAIYSREDIERRWARARSLMAKAELDALLITNEENFQYFTGSTGTLTLHYSLTRPAVLVFPREGEPIAVLGEMLADSVRMTTYVTDLRGYSDVLRFPQELVVDALRDAGAGSGQVGAELGPEQRMGMPVGDYLSVVEALPQARIRDAAELLIKLRMVKTPEEVGYMREAARITGRARQRLFDEVVPRMTERDVVRNLRRLILEEGGDRTSFVHLISGTPASHSQHHLDRPLEKDSVLYGRRRRLRALPHHRLCSLGNPRPGHRRGPARPRDAARSE